MKRPRWFRSARGSDGFGLVPPLQYFKKQARSFYLLEMRRACWLAADRRRVIGQCHAQGLTLAETVQVTIGSQPEQWQVLSLVAEVGRLGAIREKPGHSPQGGDHVLQ